MQAHTRALLTTEPGADIGAALSGLCRTATDEHHVSGAVVTLMTATPTGVDQVVAGVSDEVSRGREQIQLTVGEGPGLDAFGSGRPVLVSDLATSLERWPGFVPEATRAGIGAAYAFPLQLGAVRFGVLTCHSDRSRTLSQDELTALLVFAEVATELLLDTTVPGLGDPSGGSVDPGLLAAMDFRTEIYQAQGMVMAQLGVSLVEALARMRAQAFAAEVSLTVLSLGILDGTIRLAGSTDE